MIAMSAGRLYGRAPIKGRKRKPKGRGARSTCMLRRASALMPALALLWFGAASALAAGPTWTLAVSENPSDQANYLTAASMLSGTDAWAVGAWYRPASTPGTLTEHWDGATWTAVPSPNATTGYNELFDVHAIATDDVWAVGYHNIANYGSEKSMTLHWDGAAWKIIRSANIGANANILRGVAGSSSNDVWAVGLGNSTSNQSGRPLVEHWNGTAWSLTRSPNTGQAFAQLEAVSVISSNDVWAVGVAGAGPSPSTGTGRRGASSRARTGPAVAASCRPSRRLPRQTSGRLARRAARPSPSTGTGPRGPSCRARTERSRRACSPGSSPSPRPMHGRWVCPRIELRVTFRTSTLHWDGIAWSVVTSPNPGPEYNALDGVAGLAGGDVWAVGNQDELTLAMRASD